MDVIVVGGGIAGASIAYELAADREVLLVEAERSLAMHTTGRSAATWIGSYGPPVVREFSRASLPFLLDPPFDVDGPVATKLECLWIDPRGGEEDLRVLANETGSQLVDATEARQICPVLRPGVLPLAVHDETSRDLDVAGLHHAYVRAFRARGGLVRPLSRVVGATRAVGEWRLDIGSGESVSAPVVVNAAGAWGDQVGGLFGAAPVGLQPRVRSIYQSPTIQPVSGLPFVVGIDGGFYFKPEGDAVLCSPQDETAADPGDPKPDELEIARSIEEINEVTTLGLRSVRTAWAGLRTFAPDGNPVARWDPMVDGLFWFVGQGGYGIQMAPALARHASSLISGAPERDV